MKVKSHHPLKQMVIEAEIKGLKYITIYNCNDAVTLGLLRKRIAALTQKLKELEQSNER